MNSTDSKLNISVGSFSYKKGLPVDPTDHGGGFIFDCRALLNPGRQAEFKEKTGLDSGVAAFIEAQRDSNDFWELVKGLIHQYVSSYRARGFNYASIQFGCTGGQHRSVYFAEKTARLLRSYPDVQVTITHRDMPR